MTEFVKALEVAIDNGDKEKVMTVLNNILEYAITQDDVDLVRRTIETIEIMKEEEEIMQNEIKAIQEEEMAMEFNHMQELSDMADKETEDWLEELFKDPVFGTNTKEEVKMEMNLQFFGKRGTNNNRISEGHTLALTHIEILDKQRENLLSFLEGREVDKLTDSIEEELSNVESSIERWSSIHNKSLNIRVREGTINLGRGY